MATWNGNKFYCRNWDNTYKDGGSDYMTWDYQTIADSFSLIHHRAEHRDGHGWQEFWTPAKTEVLYFCPDEAETLYLTMRDYVQTYLGNKRLAELDAKQMKVDAEEQADQGVVV